MQQLFGCRLIMPLNRLACLLQNVFSSRLHIQALTDNIPARSNSVSSIAHSRAAKLADTSTHHLRHRGNSVDRLFGKAALGIRLIKILILCCPFSKLLWHRQATRRSKH